MTAAEAVPHDAAFAVAGAVRGTTTGPATPEAPLWMCANVAGRSMALTVVNTQARFAVVSTAATAVPLPSGSPPFGTSAAPPISAALNMLTVSWPRNAPPGLAAVWALK